MDEGETRNRIVPKKSFRCAVNSGHQVNAKRVPQNRTRKFGQFSPPLEADANADGRTTPAVKVALVLSAFVLAYCQGGSTTMVEYGGASPSQATQSARSRNRSTSGSDHPAW